MIGPLIPLGLLGAAAVYAVLHARQRGGAAGRAHARGWMFSADGADLARTWTLPPFVYLRTPNTAGLDAPDPDIVISDVGRFGLHGSLAVSLTVTHVLTLRGETTRHRHHVVGVRTRQSLPRTMVRCGSDVYAMPLYDGLRRIRRPSVTIRDYVLGVISDDAAAGRLLPLADLSQAFDAEGMHGATVVTDGDWIYVYRDSEGDQNLVETMLAIIERFARLVPDRAWPIPGETHTTVYGAV